ncbi:MAG: hypothetical protein P4L69_15590 [Desulfosporosinus sp.]|nr:hypothetical protein [Desulfosporosinus sp.]
MASKKAQELAEQLLGMNVGGGGSSSVEGIMAGGGSMGGCHQYGGAVKDFYAKHRTPVLAVSAVVGVAVIGIIGYAVYKKYMWQRPLTEAAAPEEQGQ